MPTTEKDTYTDYNQHAHTYLYATLSQLRVYKSHITLVLEC